MRFFPKNIDFFKFFNEQALELQKAIKILRKLEKDKNIIKCAKRMKIVEHNADDITHKIIKNLNQTFITPIDREDITLLTSHMDNVIDELDRAINRLYIYQIDPLPQEVFFYSHMIEKAIWGISRGIQELNNSKKPTHVLQHCEEINLIENRADALHRRTLKKIFEEGKDAIMIIKLKEIYDTFEQVTDRCEDVANMLETIIVKNL